MSKIIFCAKCNTQFPINASCCFVCGSKIGRLETPLEARVTALEAKADTLKERLEKGVKILNKKSDLLRIKARREEGTTRALTNTYASIFEQVADALRGDK